jgi:hypothetical protein
MSNPNTAPRKFISKPSTQPIVNQDSPRARKFAADALHPGALAEPSLHPECSENATASAANARVIDLLAFILA